MTIAHAKAPLRLGLAGGGTDVSPYSDEFGGQVLNATISLFTHCHIEEAQGREVEFLAADSDEMVRIGAAPESNDLALQLHRAVYRRMAREFLAGDMPGLKVTTYSDAPPGSGVGSSSSLVVAMVKAYAEYLQLPLREYEVAQLAYDIERVDCGLAGGKQDQYAAAFGGFNFMEFGPRDRVVVSPLRLRRDVGSQSSLGLLATTRQGEGDSNSVLGLDGRLALGGRSIWTRCGRSARSRSCR